MTRNKTPAPSAAGRPAEKHLGVMVSPEVWQQVRAAATARNMTIRTLLLSALREAGINIPAHEIEDRRK